MLSIATQFTSNLGVMTKQQQRDLHSKSVVIIGLGGLGGHVANNLARLGVGTMYLIDFDVFDETNINRQLFSNHENIGKYKVDVVKEKLLAIYPSCNIIVHNKKIETLELNDVLHIDYIIDAVDSPLVKKFISSFSNKRNIPLLHGACAGWYGQLGWITPGCPLIHQLYEHEDNGLEKDLLNPTFTPSFIASMMAAEFVKYIQHPAKATVDQLLLIDILNNTIIRTGDTNG